MDIYNGPVGLANQIHDYSPGIPPSGLFWLVSAPHDAVQVHLGSGTASVQMTDVPVLDAHDIKNALTGGPTVPATVSFDIEWSNVPEFYGSILEDGGDHQMVIESGGVQL